MVKIGLAESLGLHNKKAPQKVLSQKWCAILCAYRTEKDDDFKDLSRKIELVEDIQKQNRSELLVV